MTNHSELLKAARELAGRLIESALPGESGLHGDSAEMLRTIANTVEHQDKMIAETVAACKTGDEAITRCLNEPSLFEKYRSESSRRVVAGLYAARDRVQRLRQKDKLETEGDPHDHAEMLRRLAECAELPAPPNNAEPPGYSEFRDRAKALMEAGAHVSREEALAMIDTECGEQPAPQPDWDRWHELLDIRAKKGGLLSPDEQAEYDRFLPILAKLDAKAAQRDDEFLRKLERVAKPPPVEVEMRVVPTTHGWTWELAINDHTSPPCKLWVTPSVLNDGIPIDTSSLAIARGNAWLTVLGKQLGVKLAAKWEPSQAAAITEAMQRCPPEPPPNKPRLDVRDRKDGG